MLARRSRERLLPLFERLFRARPAPPTPPARKIWREWSIGIFEGDSPLHLAPVEGIVNPVVTSAQVSDVPADFVADPFLIRVGTRWHMFFEVWNRQSKKGEIGLAVSDDTKSWAYQKIVLAEPFHLSYPHVFEWNGDYYMVPESCAVNSVRLYRATRFPVEWSFARTLLEGRDYVDSSLFHANDRWWLFAGTGAPPYRADTLHLFHAQSLTDVWRQHPKSPVVRGNVHMARPAGRVLVQGGRIARYAQDCDGGYGLRVRAVEVTELTTRRYREREFPESPILTPSGAGWNASGMHHVDPHCLDDGRWLACVDGQIAHEWAESVVEEKASGNQAQTSRS
jgi:hypothetical protein